MRGPDQRQADALLTILGFTVGALAVQATTVGAIALLDGDEFPRLTVWELIGLWGQVAPADVTGQDSWPVAHWAIVAIIAGAVLLPAAVGLRSRELRRRPQAEALRKGTASRRELVKHAGAKQLVARAGRLRPSLAGRWRVRPEQVGYRLGTSRGVSVWMSVEDSMVLVGPSRSGKGRNFVVPMLTHAMGAVVTTSTRPDNLYLTFDNRERVGGPVYVFDPMGVAGGVGDALRWSPIEGSEDLDVAMRRLQSLIPADGFAGVQNSSYWEATSKKIILALFHAAALDERTIEDFWQWISDPNLARSEALEILNTHPDADRATARSLAAVLSSTAEQRGNDWASAYADVAYLASPRLRASMTPSPDEPEFDPQEFIESSGTLYLIGDAGAAAASAPLIAALIEELSTVAQRIAGQSPGARLDPPLQLILDEAASFKVPSLPNLISYAGGSGLTVVVVLQSIAQAELTWGREAARSLWSASSLKMVLPGGTDVGELKDLQHLIGDAEVARASVTRSNSGESRQYSSEQRSVISPAGLRTMASGTGLLVQRQIKPTVLSLARNAGASNR